MLKGFRDFIMRGNVVDLAVAVVIGAAFGALVKSLVSDILMPIITAVFGKPSFSGLSFTIHNSVFGYGAFLDAVITFLMIAAAIYFFVVVPMNKVAELRAKGQDPTTKECPECLSEIPHAARKCAFCASAQPAQGTGPSAAGLY